MDQISCHIICFNAFCPLKQKIPGNLPWLLRRC